MALTAIIYCMAQNDWPLLIENLWQWDFAHNLKKVLYVACMIIELGIAVQIQNIGESFFTRPLLLRLDAHTGWVHMTMNEIKCAAFSANWQPGVPKYNCVNWQWAGYTD